jgi:hypothetical protein
VKFETAAENFRGVLIEASKERLRITAAQCPECGLLTISIEKESRVPGGGYRIVSEQVVWPLSGYRPPAPPEVPLKIAQDFNESSIVLPFSAKASAALSRRCLQTLLRETGKTKAKDLFEQIDEVLPALPTYIAQNLDAVRHIGNFAAHPIKSKDTGTVFEVELGEAEWNLDVLEALFDFYYIKPELEKKKREQLNQKLQEAGKPPLKQP